MPEVIRPAPIPLWAIGHYSHAYASCSVPMKLSKSKKSILALIVINQMRICSQALSSRPRTLPSVFRSANGVRAPSHVGKCRVKGLSLRLGGAPGWAQGRGAVREKIGFGTE